MSTKQGSHTIHTPYVQTRSITTGELIRETFDVLATSRRALGIYALVFGGLGLLTSIAAIASTVSTFSFFLYFIGQYWLCRQMLLASGAGHVESFKVFSLFFMAVILGVGISLGFNFFVIPGILLGAKWVMSPAYLVAQENNLFEAIGASWRASDGNTVSLSLAYTLICVIGVLALWGVATVGAITQGVLNFGGSLVNGPVEGVFVSLTLNTMPILMMALSVGAYRLLSEEMDNLTDVFE